MTTLASLLGRKAAPAAAPAPAPDRPERNVLELDQELFFPIASQLGEENEQVRNLLIDAEHKISELDAIKSTLGKLIDPIGKTLRAFEEAKSEKLSLQGVLNSTRIAYSKLRDDLTAAEKRAATLDAEAVRLRELLTVAQQSVAALEATRSEQSAELGSRRAQIADLQRIVQQQSSDLQAARGDSQRAAERAAIADGRLAKLEADSAAATQNFLLADRERSAVQALLDKALNDCAQMSRRLTDTDKALAAKSAELTKAEAALAQAQADRARLAAAVEEATETHRREAAAQHARFEALQARAELSDRLLEESRQTLAARADEISAFDRRLSEATLSRGAIESRFGQVEAALAERDAEIKELQQANAAMAERNADLTRAVTSRESAYNRAQEKIQAQDDLIRMLEGQIKADRETANLEVEELKAQLQRERLDRTMADGALEAGRKDIARLLREIASLQYRPAAAGQAPAQPAGGPRVQNAA